MITKNYVLIIILEEITLPLSLLGKLEMQYIHLTSALQTLQVLLEYGEPHAANDPLYDIIKLSHYHRVSAVHKLFCITKITL